MRMFLHEYDRIVTEEELQEEYKENGYQYEMPFCRFLEICLDKNGSLTEILTDDTPRMQRPYAVLYCSVCDENTEDELDDLRWLTYDGRQMLSALGYRVQPVSVELFD